MSVKIIKNQILVKLEFDDQYYDITAYNTLRIKDKLEIAGFLQEQLIQNANEQLEYEVENNIQRNRHAHISDHVLS